MRLGVRVLLLVSVAIVTVALCAPAALAVSTGGEVFLQGNYVEVGIHDAGSFGTYQSAPSWFHPWPYSDSRGSGPLGYVADFGKDGWDVGEPPQSGDYLIPGTPEEGWAVEWMTGGDAHIFGNFGLLGQADVPTTSLSETSWASTLSARWRGTASDGAYERLAIEQNVHFGEDDLFFVVDIRLTNIGSETLESVEYMRNVDPDQENPITSNFTTSNSTPWSPSGPEGEVLVVAKGLDYGVTIGLGAIDSRAVVSVGGFSNRDPDYIWNNPGMFSADSPHVGDEAITIVFNVGDLAPGQSATFRYATMFDEADFDDLAEMFAVNTPGTVKASGTLTSAGGTVQSNARVGLQARFIDGDATPTGSFSGTLGRSTAFKSTQFESLSIDDRNALLTGIGTWNGKAGYRFEILLCDGDASVGALDRMRLRVWKVSSGELMFDSYPGVSDGTMPSASRGITATVKAQ